MACRIPLGQRIARRAELDPETGCLNWTGALSRKGYGVMSKPGVRSGVRGLRVHRAAYELAKGPIPDGLVIDHLCRNKRCCNPDHLEAVTAAENTKRARRPHCKRGHPYSVENTGFLSRGERYCKRCRNERRAAGRATETPPSETRGATAPEGATTPAKHNGMTPDSNIEAALAARTLEQP